MHLLLLLSSIPDYALLFHGSAFVDLLGTKISPISTNQALSSPSLVWT